MSFSKSLCLSSDSLKRQSFSERIWDDLSEEILQYLSLEDKLRLECVSKQFQRTIYQKHYELAINVSRAFASPFFQNKRFDLKSLESMLKKCSDITSIELIGYYYGFRSNNYNEFIVLITKYCNNLVEFKSPFHEISVSAYEGFHNKFGTKFKVFKPPNGLKNFHNLEELSLHWMSSTHLQLISKHKLEKLKKLNVTIDYGEEGLIQRLIDSLPSLRYLDLDFIKLSSIMVLRNISKLNDLIHLKMKRFGSSLSTKIFSDSVKEIAKNCLKLKSFHSDVDLLPGNELTLRQSLSPLKGFKQLKRLRLVIEESVDEQKGFSMNAFEGLSKLTHLTLAFHRPNPLKLIKKFTDIDHYLPNLQYLQLINTSKAQVLEFKQIADILSQLSKLNTIKIVSHFDNFSKDEEEITEKCRQIKNVLIKYEENYSALLEYADIFDQNSFF